MSQTSYAVGVADRHLFEVIHQRLKVADDEDLIVWVQTRGQAAALLQRLTATIPTECDRVHCFVSLDPRMLLA